MAPRSAKAKKAVKVSDNDAPKKGRGKAKNVAEPEPELDVELSEKSAPVNDKKPTKRGKKAVNDSSEQVNDKADDVGPPARKGRKKNVDDSNSLDKQASNGDQSAEEESLAPTEETEQSDENVEESNGHTEEAPSSGRGRKKQAKKEPAKKAEPRSGRGRKPKQETVESEDTPKEEVEEKPKSAAKGRGRKAAKVETEPEAEKSDAPEVEIKEKPAPKGRKKAPAKVQEKENDEDEDVEKEEDKPEPKKKEPKGRKNQGKKAQPKEEVQDEEEDETPSSKKRKVTKKAEAKNEEEDVAVEVKPAKGKRGQKKVVEVNTETDEVEEAQDNEPTTKRRRKGTDEKASAGDTKKKAPLKIKSLTDYESIDFSNSSSDCQGIPWNFKISTWNVDGIRAWATKGGLDFLKYENPDILCVQETKCSPDKLPSEIANVPGYHAYWAASEKEGYAGVGIYTKKLAMNVIYGLQHEEFDKEGRVLTAEYEQCYVVCVYVPNSGRNLVTLPKRLLWNEEFRKHVQELDKKKPVIICGDMNVAYEDIDLTYPGPNRRNAGFTNEERASMSHLIDTGFVDSFRQLYPFTLGSFTFWTYMNNARAKNIGWRLDYFITSLRLLSGLCDVVIRNKVYGSDHCPVTLFQHFRAGYTPKVLPSYLFEN